MQLKFYVTIQVRLYRLAIPDDEIVEHIGYESLELPVWKSYGNLHFKMEESTGATTLTNSGRLSGVTTLSGGTFVRVSLVAGVVLCGSYKCTHTLYFLFDIT